MALRPRLSPGVPLSWMRIVLLTLRTGTAVVKNSGLEPSEGIDREIANIDARGESRTRTRLPSADFESAASAIPPLGRGWKIAGKREGG